MTSLSEFIKDLKEQGDGKVKTIWADSINRVFSGRLKTVEHQLNMEHIPPLRAVPPGRNNQPFLTTYKEFAFTRAEVEDVGFDLIEWNIESASFKILRLVDGLVVNGLQWRDLNGKYIYYKGFMQYAKVFKGASKYAPFHAFSLASHELQMLRGSYWEEVNGVQEIKTFQPLSCNILVHPEDYFKMRTHKPNMTKSIFLEMNPELMFNNTTPGTAYKVITDPSMKKGWALVIPEDPHGCFFSLHTTEPKFDLGIDNRMPETSPIYGVLHTRAALVMKQDGCVLKFKIPKKWTKYPREYSEMR